MRPHSSRHELVACYTEAMKTEHDTYEEIRKSAERASKARDAEEAELLQGLREQAAENVSE